MLLFFLLRTDTFEFGNGASLGATACGEPLKPRYAAEHIVFCEGLRLMYPILRRVFALLLETTNLLQRCSVNRYIFASFELAYPGAPGHCHSTVRLIQVSSWVVAFDSLKPQTATHRTQGSYEYRNTHIQSAVGLRGFVFQLR